MVGQDGEISTTPEPEVTEVRFGASMTQFRIIMGENQIIFPWDGLLGVINALGTLAIARQLSIMPLARHLTELATSQRDGIEFRVCRQMHGSWRPVLNDGDTQDTNVPGPKLHLPGSG